MESGVKRTRKTSTSKSRVGGELEDSSSDESLPYLWGPDERFDERKTIFCPLFGFCEISPLTGTSHNSTRAGYESRQFGLSDLTTETLDGRDAEWNLSSMMQTQDVELAKLKMASRQAKNRRRVLIKLKEDWENPELSELQKRHIRREMEVFKRLSQAAEVLRAGSNREEAMDIADIALRHMAEIKQISDPSWVGRWLQIQFTVLQAERRLRRMPFDASMDLPESNHDDEVREFCQSQETLNGHSRFWAAVVERQLSRLAGIEEEGGPKPLVFGSRMQEGLFRMDESMGYSGLVLPPHTILRAEASQLGSSETRSLRAMRLVRQQLRCGALEECEGGGGFRKGVCKTPGQKETGLSKKMKN